MPQTESLPQALADLHEDTAKDLVKAKVTKVEKGKITVESRKKPFMSVGKYACDCGPDCKCDTISQNPGNCTCGKKMVEVKAKVKK